MIEAFGLNGCSVALQTSCCAGLDSIGYAARAVAQGEYDVAICGGTEAPLYRTPLMELRAANLTPINDESSDKLCRPFDLWRTTGVVGEGAAVMILEPESSPRPALAWLDGYCPVSDDPSRLLSGLTEAALTALANAGMRVDEVESLNLWGPGHREIDAAEVVAMQRVFGDSLPLIPALSIKGAVGSALGAAGAIQAITAALSLCEGVLPPTVNWEHPDPVCRLALSATARYLPVENALINAHGMSVANSCVVLRRK